MSEDKVELGRRVVACKGWRWMPGMRWWTDDDRGRLDDYQPEYMARSTDALPDLTDPATVGCLLALVRKAWGDPAIYASTENDGTWGVFNTDDWLVTHKHDSEAEALVAALEGAP